MRTSRSPAACRSRPAPPPDQGQRREAQQRGGQQARAVGPGQPAGRGGHGEEQEGQAAEPGAHRHHVDDVGGHEQRRGRLRAGVAGERRRKREGAAGDGQRDDAAPRGRPGPRRTPRASAPPDPPQRGRSRGATASRARPPARAAARARAPARRGRRPATARPRAQAPDLSEARAEHVAEHGRLQRPPAAVEPAVAPCRTRPAGRACDAERGGADQQAPGAAREARARGGGRVGGACRRRPAASTTNSSPPSASAIAR